MVRAEGLEPSRALRPNGFLTRHGFRRPCAFAGFVVWTIPSPCPVWPGVGAARLVSTPSGRCSGRAWLGIASYRFPRL